jgi:glucose/mannose-6-phosphate isomerase
MKKLIEGFPAQLEEALGIAAAASLSPAKAPIHNVLICGMGGSGIGANLIQTFLYDELTVPVSVNKSYDIPAFVSPNTLVIACSYSGGTEETLSGVEQAFAKGAQVVGVTSGGKLGDLLTKNSSEFIVIPSRDASPRAGVGYAFTQLLFIFKHFGLSASDHFDDVRASAFQLTKYAKNIQADAEEMAEKLKGKFPIFYADARLEPVLLRNQQQIAENSKQFSHQNFFPEMNHNELVGWRFPEGFLETTVTVMLRTDYDNERSSTRMDICEDIFEKAGTQLEIIGAKGQSFIQQAIYLVHLLDWVSYYLAVENDVDPFPVDVITFLKNELAKV